MVETTRAEQVLAIILESVALWDGDEYLAVDVQSAWTEKDDVVCLVYRQTRMYPGLTLGLRRTVEHDWSVEGVADEVIMFELGEPLGSLYETLTPDESGVMWWTGNLPAWKERR